MQTKSKLKSKKTSEIGVNQQQSQIDIFSITNQFVEVGAICGDGTFTEYTGRGAGSHHCGIRHKVYAKRSQLNPLDKALTSKATTTSSTLSFKSQQNTLIKESSQAQLIPSSSQKKKTKKISLKEMFKTKTKKQALYEKVYEIFDTLFKDKLQLVEQELDDELWLIMASICNLYDQLEESSNLAKTLQSSFAQQIKKSASKQEKNIDLKDTKTLELQIKTLSKQNQSLNKQIQKLTKSSNLLSQNLNEHKSREKKFKRMLKLIEKQNPRVLSNALEQSMIDIKELKKDKTQSRVVTRSMLKKQQSMKEDKKFESLFSSDQSSYDEDHTLVGLIKSMK